MTIGKKIYGGFGIMIVLLLMFGGYSLSEMLKVTSNYEQMLDHEVIQMQHAEAIQKEMAMQGMFLRAFISEREDSTLSMFETHQDLLKKTVEAMRTNETPPEMITLLDDITEQIGLYDKGALEIVSTVKSGDAVEADRLMNLAVRDSSIAIETAAVQLGQLQSTQLQKKRTETTAKAASAKRGLGTSIIVDTVLALLLAFFIKRSISKPIRTLVNGVSIVANGDLTQQDIMIKSKDEIKDLATAFNSMKHNLRSLIGSINASSLQVTASAEELSASTENVTTASQDMSLNMEAISSGAQTSAVSAKESSHAMEETASAVNRVAESAQLLNENAANTEKLARERGESVKIANEQMVVIHDSAQLTSDLIKHLSSQTIEIENITNVITNLTEQTNLLALNAAIEAARAGEQGKGFAVVADEVRKLAEQSKASASQIVTITAGIQDNTKNVAHAVSDSLTNVEQGVKAIDDAGQAFTYIIAAIQTMGEQIEDISAATQEISASSEQVSASVNEIALQADESSNKTAENSEAVKGQMATIEEINSVAHDLNEQAIRLQETIHEFKV